MKADTAAFSPSFVACCPTAAEVVLASPKAENPRAKKVAVRNRITATVANLARMRRSSEASQDSSPVSVDGWNIFGSFYTGRAHIANVKVRRQRDVSTVPFAFGGESGWGRQPAPGFSPSAPALPHEGGEDHKSVGYWSNWPKYFLIPC